MDKKMGLWDKLVASFDNSPEGFSARKLSAFTAVMVALVATFRFADEKVIIHTLMVWLTFALLCMGIITAEQVLKFYKKDGDSPAAPAASAPSDNQPDPKM
jgi:hypothetical protein